MKSLKNWRPDVFRLIGGALLAATLVTVPLELGPWAANQLSLSGRWAAVAYGLVAVCDLLWLAALSRVPAALRQRQRVALAVALGIALAGAAGSVVLVALYGSAPVLAFVPAAALAVHGLGKLLDATLADGATDADIRMRQQDDRNRAALAAQGVRSLTVTRSLAAAAKAAELTADQDDADALEAALTAALAAREIRRTKQAAQLEGKLSKTAGKHGTDAEAFRARGLLGTADTKEATAALRGVAGALHPAAPSVPLAAVPDSVPAVPLGATSGNAGNDADGNASGNLVPAAPKHSDEELMAAGRKVWAQLGRPRTKTAFRDAMKAAGFGGRTVRLNAVYDQLAADAIADAADLVGQPVDADEIEQDDQTAA